MKDNISKPKITIGLPSYNGANTIQRAIDSLVNQTYSNFELIISDDDSSDSTSEICQKYKLTDKRIKFIKNKDRKGWINNLTAGGGINGSNFKDFNFSISLTDLGIDHYQDIVEIIFAYLPLLKKDLAKLTPLYQDKKTLLQIKETEIPEFSNYGGWNYVIRLDVKNSSDPSVPLLVTTNCNDAVHEDQYKRDMN